MATSGETDLFANGIEPWAASVRSGDISFATTMEFCIDRIQSMPTLNAFEVLDEAVATNLAKAMDTELAEGKDRGPLMGLPIGVKDIMAAQGMPTTNGSNADTEHLSGTEGTVLKQLRLLGAIPVGKTKTVEFALGVTGINAARGTPWNPVDETVHRLPGGSSSGSAVATAAGCIGLGLGTDTGGSVRIPACFTGIFGHKTSVGRWPTDGIFSLSRTLDSVGPLVRCARDAALLHEALFDELVPNFTDIEGLRVGVPKIHFLDHLDRQVASDFENSLAKLTSLGAELIDMEFPEAAERSTLFPLIVPPELLSFLGTDLFLNARNGMDPVTAERAAHGLTVSAVQYLEALRRQEFLIAKANSTFANVDVWVSPTVPFLPMPLADLEEPAQKERALEASRNTQPGNLLEFCATTLPMQRPGTLPSGFQIMMPHGKDAECLGLSVFLEPHLR
ncbi:MAG: amidase [Gammaproteobacteria bacterium]|nr:amidase [Gammaproteobacteria bacterium]